MDNNEMLEKYKQRIKRQNEKIKQDYDRASVTLPKGTKDRIQALGYTINGFLNFAVLAELEKLEAEAPQTAQPEATKEEQPEQTHPKADAPEDVAELNNWLHQIQQENEQRRLDTVRARQIEVERDR